jgi:endonuclease YncB( thermonuclease family)
VRSPPIARGWAGLPSLLAATLLLPSLCAGSANADELRGATQVQDGDTLVVAGEKVRLLDVDAPELAQRCEGGPKELAACGKIAAEMLEAKLAGATITCHGDERDDYDRLLARCSLGGEDLSTWLVEQGWGLAFRR